MPDNFIVSFDGGNGIKGDEHCNACLLISTKEEDGSILVIHEYTNKEAIHLWYIMNAIKHDSDNAYVKYTDVTMITEK